MVDLFDLLGLQGDHCVHQFTQRQVGTKRGALGQQGGLPSKIEDTEVHCYVFVSVNFVWGENPRRAPRVVHGWASSEAIWGGTNVVSSAGPSRTVFTGVWARGEVARC